MSGASDDPSARMPLGAKPAGGEQPTRKPPACTSSGTAEPSATSPGVEPMPRVSMSQKSMSTSQKRVRDIIEHQKCKIAIQLVVVVSMILVIVDTDIQASGEDAPPWLKVLNALLLLLYFVEMQARLFVLRWDFFLDWESSIDLVAVVADTSLTLADAIWDIAIPMGFVRIVRILKVTRVLRTMTRSTFPELNLMVRGMVMATRSLMWGVMLLFLLLNLWSILAIMFIHPLVQDLDRKGVWADQDCQHCPRTYSSWAHAMLTFGTTFIAGGDFGQLNIPIMEHYPVSVMFFVVVMVVTTLLALNLLLGLVVERAMEAKQVTIEEQAKEKKEKFESMKDELMALAIKMDMDESGCVDRKEFEAHCNKDETFINTMRALDIRNDELSEVFNILDRDGDNRISYDEFVDTLYEFMNRNDHTMLIFLEHYMGDIRRQLYRRSAPSLAGFGSRGASRTWLSRPGYESRQHTQMSVISEPVTSVVAPRAAEAAVIPELVTSVVVPCAAEAVHIEFQEEARCGWPPCCLSPVGSLRGPGHSAGRGAAAVPSGQAALDGGRMSL
mmetsp:Transcript_19388/g.55595  ORF Transcript_19388/g.55595 Transcript_19388/m.55595 type:complete len:556 (+) Transcript_19388:46-1713(+)